CKRVPIIPDLSQTREPRWRAAASALSLFVAGGSSGEFARTPPFSTRYSLARWLSLALSLTALAGCAHRQHATQPPVQSAPLPAPYPAPPAPSRSSNGVEAPPAVPGQYVEEGVASWY